jgi:sulfur-carrier protein
MPRILVVVPSPLRRTVGGVPEVEAEGETVPGALASLRSRHPALAHLVLQDDDQPRPGVKLFLNGEDLRGAGRLEASLSPGDRLSLVLAIAGG